MSSVLDRLVPVPECGCWLWTGCTTEHGYGRLGVKRNGRWVSLLAHRAAWEEVIGEIPDGAYVLHKCDTPACCNPSHLFLGDQMANIKDMIKKHRRVWRTKTHCKNWHPLSGINRGVNAKGASLCRKCRSDYNRKRYIAMKQENYKCIP